MCSYPKTFTYPPSVYDRLIGLNTFRNVTIPCGKCFDCLRKRQNDLATRVYLEAKNKGSAVFVTLTYRPSTLPLASSHWQIDKSTGEAELLEGPDLVAPELIAEKRADIYKAMLSARYDSNFGAVCLEEHIQVFEDFDPEHEHLIRITPTLYYNDVQLALKRFRKICDKSFSYVSVGEYGSSPVGFNRPHYHLIFFGLSKDDLKYLSDDWTSRFGYTYIQQVNFLNKDGSDGLARVSRYVGKYCAKGTLDIYTVREGCTISNRLHSSKGLGYLDEKQIDYMLAKDIFPYDVQDPLNTIPKVLLPTIVDRIIERSFININGFKFPLPSSLIRKIYGYKRTDSKGFSRPEGFKSKFLEISEKAIYNPIYYLVASELRSRSTENNYLKLESLAANVDTEDFSSAVIQVEAIQNRASKSRENALRARLLNSYKSSKLIGY